MNNIKDKCGGQPTAHKPRSYSNPPVNRINLLKTIYVFRVPPNFLEKLEELFRRKLCRALSPLNFHGRKTWQGLGEKSRTQSATSHCSSAVKQACG